MKTLIVTNFDVSRTVQKLSWFRKKVYYQISMSLMIRNVPAFWFKNDIPGIARIRISGCTFDVNFVTQERDGDGQILYEVTLEQVGHSTKRLNKRLFQYADIETIPL